MARSTTFTSYVNIEQSKGIDTSLSALERKANSTFARIAANAQKAANASTGAPGVSGGQSVGQIQGLANAERQRAAALQRSVAASNAAAAASSRLAGKHMLESNAARAAAASTSSLERSLRLASVAANVAQGPLGPLAGRLSAVATAVSELSGVRLGLVGAGALGATFVRAASSAQELKSKLFPLFESQQDVNTAFRDTIRIANDARLSLEPVVDLYARLTLGGRDVGLTQQQIARTTEIAAKAARLSGGTQISQDAGLFQFAQGLGSGNLAGDELKSVREGTLRLAKAIADGLGVSISELKKLGSEGKLTATVVADALESQSARIDAELAKLPPTISSATSKLNTAFLEMINGADEAGGVTVALATGLGLLADNLGLVARSALYLATAYAAVKAVDMARSTLANVSAWQAERTAILRNAAAAQEVANTTRRTSAQRIVELRAERAAIRARIASEQQLATTTRQTAIASFRRVSGPDYIGSPRDFAGYRTAVEQATVANTNFSASKQRLAAVTSQLRDATGQLTTSTVAYRNAGEQAGRSANVFASAARGLWGVIGPNLLGLALGVGISLLIEFAFREDAAAGAADRMAERQSNLARVVDFTTGKINNQNAALVALQAQQLATAATEARGEYIAARRQAIRESQRRTSYAPNSTGAPTEITVGPGPEISSITRQYGRNANASQVVSQLEDLRRRRPDLDRQISTQVTNFGNLARLAQEGEQARAGSEYLRGNRSAENLRRLQGNFSGRNADQVTGSVGAGANGGGGGGGGGGATAAGRRNLASATDELAKAERELQAAQTAGDKRTDILSRYEQQSNALRRAAKDTRELQQLVGTEILDARFQTAANREGRGLYTQAMADADRAAIEYGLRQPIREALAEQERGIEISRLRLEGYESEANALEQALSIQDQIGSVSRAEFEQLVANERQQLRINDALESRQRSVQGVLDAANATRDAFADLLVNAGKNPVGAIKNFGATIFNNIANIEARRITEKLFAGADEKLRDLVSGSNGVDRAAEVLASSVERAAEPLPALGSAADTAASALENAATRINAAANGIGAGGIQGLAPSASPTTSPALQAQFDAAFGNSQLAGVARAVTSVAGIFVGGGRSVLAAVPTLAGAVTQIAAEASGAPATSDEIVVPGRRRPAPVGPDTPSGTSAYGAVFRQLGENLDRIFKSGSFFKGIGNAVGRGIAFAGNGQIASGVLGLTGIRQSSTGSALGGAAGGFLGTAIGGPLGGQIGSFIGGAIGGTIGGLLKKTKTGSVSLGRNEFGVAGVVGTGGNSASTRRAVEGLGGSVTDQLNQIADAFGGQVGAFNVSIGRRGDEFRVNGSGGSTTGKRPNSRDTIYRGDDEQAAIAAAVQNAIEDGAIGGISAAAQNILRSGQNLQTAINKALAIESIPKRLLQRTDPVRYAVTELNREFEQLISYLREGGATAEQFADAQRLYDLERADAIEQATRQSVAALQAYLDEMRGGSSSPFNRRTVYENASERLASFRGDIAAGRTVDENSLLTAARDFQNASQELYGSSADFFRDFEDLFNLLSQARDNAGGSASTTPLPASPFGSPDAASYLAQLNSTTQNQTDVLASRLEAILAAVQGNSILSGVTNNIALGLLPGVNVR